MEVLNPGLADLLKKTSLARVGPADLDDAVARIFDLVREALDGAKTMG